MRILLVDDEQIALTSVKRLLKHQGLRQVDICDNGQEAIEAIKNNDYDVVLLDLLMPEIDGLQVLEAGKPFRPHTEFILLTAVDDISHAVKAIRLGAYDYLIKPVENERLFRVIDHAFERRAMRTSLPSTSSLQEQEEVSQAFPEIISQSPRIQKLLHYAEMMARTDNPILITGESGTGKELIAHAIHRLSGYGEGPFVPVNVCSVAESMFESQFFGHVQGAFTGANRDYPGFFEQAHGGTLFLDEIGELPLNLQAKFLRVLEEKTITRLGDPQPAKVDVRIVSATNVDLDKACQEGKFRLDLIYRLKAAHIYLPPLRERPRDLSLLARHFLQKAAAKHNKHIHDFSPDALDSLGQKQFPGNIRELAQLVENAVLQADEDLILPHHFGEKQAPATFLGQSLCSLKENADKHLLYVLSQSKGDRPQAAKILGVTVRQVQRKLAKLKKDPRWHELTANL
ncbi:MAG: sigma-54 dependent transcriptional regulator [Thermodesulfobacteriota bacterium]